MMAEIMKWKTKGRRGKKKNLWEREKKLWERQKKLWEREKKVWEREKEEWRRGWVSVERDVETNHHHFLSHSTIVF